MHRVPEPPPSEELRTRNGLRYGAFARVLLELAPRETRAELDRLIAEAARRNLLDVAAIDRALARRRVVRGVAELQRALESYRPGRLGRSGLERVFAAWLTEHPEIPEPERNVDIGPWEVDFLWPAQRLAVETDGRPYHLTPSELERDRVKDGWLQRHGIHVLRVTEFRFEHDKPGILGDLCGLLQAA